MVLMSKEGANVVELAPADPLSSVKGVRMSGRTLPMEMASLGRPEPGLLLGGLTGTEPVLPFALPRGYAPQPEVPATMTMSIANTARAALEMPCLSSVQEPVTAPSSLAAIAAGLA